MENDSIPILLLLPMVEEKATKKVHFRNEKFVDGDQMIVVNSNGNPLRFDMNIVGRRSFKDILFQSKANYVRALTEGPWIVYGNYLTVQPWSEYFSTSQPFSSDVIAWIRLPSIPKFMYRKNIIETIEELVGRVIKLDSNTYSRVQQWENESHPNVCFSCGHYNHKREICIMQVEQNGSMEVGGVILSMVKGVLVHSAEVGPQTMTSKQVEIKAFSEWMLVSLWNRKPIRKPTTGDG
ncbi:hypothetical protein PVK06_004631 [Gossypium arboreum]|uniref:DUF4283 domain-containing protein n=1 Tax=Gossypium arboreum TaxID=29729 RepID=A0ABR0QSJ9_GOSAR|nr:hypothetical protein PVK06_004631 [Gossypium arboreum]